MQVMQKDLSYLNPEGFTVFTSQFHKNRGTCCKSACLHCPYGYTIKKHGIEFKAIGSGDEHIIQEILEEANQPSLEWKSFLPDNILFIQIKGAVAGLILKNHIVVKKLVLKKQFEDQGISRELVESYLFI